MDSGDLGGREETHGTPSDPAHQRLPVDFMWRSVAFLENRVYLTDVKASIIMAVLVGVLVGLNATVPIDDLRERGGLSVACAVAAFVSIAVVIFLWLMTIRPSWRTETSSSTVMWLKPSRSPDIGRYRQLVLADPRGEDALVTTHRALLRAVARKFVWYQRAMLATKLLVPVLAVLALPILLTD